MWFSIIFICILVFIVEFVVMGMDNIILSFFRGFGIRFCLIIVVFKVISFFKDSVVKYIGIFMKFIMIFVVCVNMVFFFWIISIFFG